MEPTIKNLFISHVHEDDEALPALKELMANSGYEVRDGSIDSSKPNDATNAEYIKTQILAPRIQWAGTFIVLISPDTHRSEWVDWEIEYAAKQGKRIVGVFMRGGQDSDIPDNFELYGDALVGWTGGGVIDAIEGKTNNWTRPDGTIRPDMAIARYSCA
jgi:hypothetical protein